MDDITPLIPFIDDAGATIVLLIGIALVWRGTKLQHERSIHRERLFMEEMSEWRKALIECLKNQT